VQQYDRYQGAHGGPPGNFRGLHMRKRYEFGEETLALESALLAHASRYPVNW
jgi:hypothetical protein